MAINIPRGTDVTIRMEGDHIDVIQRAPEVTWVDVAYLAGKVAAGASLALQTWYVYQSLPELPTEPNLDPNLLIGVGAAVGTATLTAAACTFPVVSDGLAWSAWKAVELTNGVGRGVCTVGEGIFGGIAQGFGFTKRVLPGIPGVIAIGGAAYLGLNRQSITQ